MLTIFVDADGCPVKEEICRVAVKCGLNVILVSNKPLRHPANPLFSSVVVSGNFDSADDWIVNNSSTDDIVVTADVLLARRSLEKNARVLNPNGRVFTRNTIGEAMALRELLSDMRDSGIITGGPAPFKPKDRSLFLHRLQENIQSITKNHKKACSQPSQTVQHRE